MNQKRSYGKTKKVSFWFFLHKKYKDATHIEIRTSVPGIEHKDTGQEVLRKLTLEMMEDNMYHALALAQIFTDGFATDAVKVGGAGILIKLIKGQEEMNIFQANRITLL